MMEKEKDKAFALSEQIKQDQDDQKRQKFFDKMNGFQVANDNKHKNHMKYMSSDPAAMAMARDEINYMKSLEQQKQKDDMKFADDRQRRERSINNTNSVLAAQIREKEMKKMNERREEQQIAEQYKQQQAKFKMEEEEGMQK